LSGDVGLRRACIIKPFLGAEGNCLKIEDRRKQEKMDRTSSLNMQGEKKGGYKGTTFARQGEESGGPLKKKRPSFQNSTGGESLRTKGGEV